ncbi:MAG: DNA/RNA nuclease SfsA [Firmicutes bacterium]|nr:DNA/RNA nuclease SfsA [Bacillota bacterium]
MDKAYHVPGRFTPARFLARPNRFVAEVELEGERVRAHVPTSGRLAELLVPDANVLVRTDVAPGRKTTCDLMLVEKDGTWVSLDSRLPNYLVGQLLRNDALPPFTGVSTVRAEFSHAAGRLDFAFTDGNGQQTLLEVKSVTLVEAGVAMFPDAPTLRGARHLAELTAAVTEGYRTAVMFVIQREDASVFRPNGRTDPDFAKALARAAEAGVEIYAWRCRAEANSLTLLAPVPVELEG